MLAAWDLQSGALLWKMTRHRYDITNIAYDARGSRLATAGVDGSVKVWDAETGALLASLEGHLQAVRFSPDGGELLTVADHEARF